VTARNAAEVEATSRELQESTSQANVVGIVADACKLNELEDLVKKVRQNAASLLRFVTINWLQGQR